MKKIMTITLQLCSKAIADRLAEALAEYLHEKVEKNTGDMQKMKILQMNN